jgi:xylulokinase
MKAANQAFIGLDIGTTNCKAVVFNSKGDILASATEEYEIIFKDNMGAEQDPETVWQKALATLLKSIKSSRVDSIVAIGLSVQGDAVIPVGANGQTISNAILGMDYRSSPQAKSCEKIFGGFNLFKKTGMPPHPMNFITKVLFIKETRKKLFDSTEKFLTYEDFFIYKLCGVKAIDLTMASRTMAVNITTKNWDSNILSKLHLDRSSFSDILPSATVVAELKPELRKTLGLKGKTFISTGAHDQVCAAIGAGAISENIALISSGTAEVLSVTLPTTYLNQQFYRSSYPCYHHAIPNKYFTFALNHSGGISLKWYRDNLAFPETELAKKTGRSPYSIIDSNLPASPTDIFLLPHFNGAGTPYCDPDAKAAIIGLTLATSRHHIAKALLEGLTFELKQNLDVFAQAGITFDEIRAVGGGSKSPVWLQLKADILDRPIVTLKNTEAACLGAAILAMVAVQHFESIELAVKNIIKTTKIYRPSAKNSSYYKMKFEKYKKIYPMLRGLLNTKGEVCYGSNRLRKNTT